MSAPARADRALYEFAPGPSELRLYFAPDAQLRDMVAAVRTAEREILLAYFTVWPCSAVSKILFDEISARKRELARQGRELVVRTLFDPINYSSALGLWLAEFHLGDSIRHLESHGIEVRLYNPGEQTRRNHAKIFVVDGRDAIVGSRNVEDISFGLSADLALTEIDVGARGAVAAQSRRAFYLYWNSPLALPPSPLGNMVDFGGNSSRERARLRECLAELPARHDFAAIRRAMDAARPPAVHRCARARLVTDLPYVYEGDRRLVPALVEMLASARQSIKVKNYSFIPTGTMAEGLNRIACDSSKPRPQILTNAQFDDVPGEIAILSHRKIAAYSPYGFRFFGASEDDARWDWGLRRGAKKVLHSKIFTVDGRSAAVTSLNLDPLSIEANVETGVIAEDCPSFAAELDQEFERLKAVGVEMTAGGRYFDQYSRTRDRMDPVRRFFQDLRATLMKPYL